MYNKLKVKQDGFRLEVKLTDRLRSMQIAIILLIIKKSYLVVGVLNCEPIATESPLHAPADTTPEANHYPPSFPSAAGENGPASSGGLHSPEVQARLESGPCAATHSPLAERNGFLQLRLHGYQASFLMSTLHNLAHFLEDDSTPQVLPMEISIRDTHINLKVRIPVVLIQCVH